MFHHSGCRKKLTLLSGFPAVYDTVWNRNGFDLPSSFSSITADPPDIEGLRLIAGVLMVEDVEPLR